MMEHPIHIWANIQVIGDGLALSGEWNHCNVNNPDDAHYIRMDEHERRMNPNTKAMMDTIAKLLGIIDDLHEALNEQNGSDTSMHTYGQTPDWYVEAAYLSCFGHTITSPSSEEASTS